MKSGSGSFPRYESGSTAGDFFWAKSEKLDPDYKREKITISTVIEEAIETYQEYKSLSPEILQLVKKYANEYGSITTVIEEAIKLLEQKKNPEMADDLDLWCRAREEMQMMLIGKRNMMCLTKQFGKLNKN